MTIRSAFLTPILLLASAAVQISCSTPVILSGADLPPEERAGIRAGPGVQIHQFDGLEVEGRHFALAPGTYSIGFSVKRDVKKVAPMLAGVIAALECKVDLDLEPGEELFVSAKLRREKSRLHAGYEFAGFHSEVRLQSSIEENSRLLEPGECEGRLDCRKLDRLQVIGMNCQDARAD